MASVQRITPNLWFDSEAEDAAKFYTSVFKNSRIGNVARYGKVGFEIHQRPPGSAMTVEFELDGQKLLKGGDPKSQRAFQAMMSMKKIDVAALKRAYDGQ